MLVDRLGHADLLSPVKVSREIALSVDVNDVVVVSGQIGSGHVNDWRAGDEFLVRQVRELVNGQLDAILALVSLDEGQGSGKVRSTSGLLSFRRVLLVEGNFELLKGGDGRRCHWATMDGRQGA